MPRTQGKLTLSSKKTERGSGIDHLRSSGAMKVLFSRSNHVLATLINTSGGLTGGDKLDLEATAGVDSHLILSTQAAERAYRAKEGRALVTTRLTAETGASLHWLPQELILFDGARLERRLHVDLAPDAKFLMVEPMVFGRTAMGETLKDAEFSDHIRVYRNGAPLYFDGMRLAGNIEQTLGARAIAQGAGAMVSLLYVAPDAAAHLAPIRALMPVSGGGSLLQPDVLALRLVAQDSHILRRDLLPALDRLTGDALPTSWRL